jgi:phosphatidylglycerol:prolipoprotein diacylglycerol transferase
MDSRLALELGPLRIHWYGIVVTLGIIVAAYVTSLELKRKGYSPNIVWDNILLVLILGIVGARLYHVFSSPNDGSNSGWAYYSQNPLQIIAIWNGGLGIFGGIIGALIGIVIISIRNKVPFLLLTDCAAPGAALGQAIGRWGNFFNQELYGGPTGSSWWGITIDPIYRIRTPKIDFTDLQTYPPETRFHPTFFYESVWSFLGFIGLMWIARRFEPHLRNGDVTACYFIWYGLGRSWTELLFRPDAWIAGASALPTAVLVGLGMMALGLLILFYNHVIYRPPAPKPATA